MTDNNAGHYAGKHGTSAVIDPVVRDAVLKRAPKGELPCAVAFELAKELRVLPDAVGRAADLLELRLVKCQLGLFGYSPQKSIVKPAVSVSQELEEAILGGLINNRLPCKTAWDIAEQLRIQRMRISGACDALSIKIGPCQLGAF
jgi:hypothetical protein